MTQYINLTTTPVQMPKGEIGTYILLQLGVQTKRKLLKRKRKRTYQSVKFFCNVVLVTRSLQSQTCKVTQLHGQAQVT